MNCVEAIRFYIHKILEPKGMKVVLMDPDTVWQLSVISTFVLSSCGEGGSQVKV
jgi:hypothetical protein